MSKILMLLFNPYSPDPRVKKEADSLVKAGHSITITAWKRNIDTKPKKETAFEVVNLGPSLKENFANKSIMAQTFCKFKTMIGFYVEVLKKTKAKKMNYVHAHDLDTLPLGIMISKLHSVPLVYDSHEIYGQMLARKLPGSCINAINYVEKKLIKNVNSMITVTDYHVEHFKKMGVKKVGRVSNYKEIITKDFEKSNNSELNLIYIGALIKARFLLEAVEVCNSIENIKLKIYGDGELYDSILKASKKGEFMNTEVPGRLPMTQVNEKTKAADIVLCMLDPSNFNNRVGPPNKLFEAMVCGRPIIATEGTYSGSVVHEEKIGIASEFNKEAFKNAVIKLKDDPDMVENCGRNSLNSALNTYNWAKEEKTLLTVYGGKA